MKINDEQKISLIPKIESFYDTDDFSGKTFGIWGLSFKPETDDVREAPSLYLTKELVKRGAKIKAYDPEATETFKRAASEEVLKSIEFVEDQKDAIKDVDALVICTEWNEFRRPSIDNFQEYMKEAIIFDGA
ncbi:MAG: UDP binding domain-containing protein [Balneolaceae bacterium]|nr:UDP binding domain-containing protein [Balneolaceae bacterium]